jgi:hypothetical protein
LQTTTTLATRAFASSLTTKLSEMSFIVDGVVSSDPGDGTNATQLVWTDTGLTGPIPPDIGQMTKLQLLSLRKNDLTGSIPPELGNLLLLTALFLYTS